MIPRFASVLPVRLIMLLARIIQEGSDIGRKTKTSAWYKCC